MLAIYSHCADDLRTCIKLAWELVGLKEHQDFHVIIKPVGSTDRDYKRLCAYILKFNGKRKTNRRIPRLFVPGFLPRKVGSFGHWFFKPKHELWREYLEELRQRRAARAVQSNFGAFAGNTVSQAQGFYLPGGSNS